jgi:hypothetical protein
LDELLDDGDRVKGAVDVDILQGVRLKDEGYAFLLGNDKDHVRVQSEVGKPEKHRNYEGLLCSKHAPRATHEVNVRLFVVQRVCLMEAGEYLAKLRLKLTYLHFGLEYDMCISRIGHAKDTSELVYSQVTNIANF